MPFIGSLPWLAQSVFLDHPEPPTQGGTVPCGMGLLTHTTHELRKCSTDQSGGGFSHLRFPLPRLLQPVSVDIKISQILGIASRSRRNLQDLQSSRACGKALCSLCLFQASLPRTKARTKAAHPGSFSPSPAIEASFERNRCGARWPMSLRRTGTRGLTCLGVFELVAWFIFVLHPLETREKLIPRPPVVRKASCQAFLLLLNKGACTWRAPGRLTSSTAKSGRL